MSKSNIRKFIEEKRQNASKNSGDVMFGTNCISSNKVASESIYKTARSTGDLNLANRNLISIPEAVYYINNSKPKSDTISFEDDNAGWWEEVFLKKLLLGSNRIKSIHNDISLLQHLVHLDLNDNEIENLELGLFELVELVFLNIGKNQLTSIPEAIGNLTNLQQLLCDNNKIVQMPTTIKNLVRLEVLDVNNNSIRTFPKEISYLVSLKKINFAYNQIKEIPYNLERLKNLHTFDVSSNHVEKFVPNFQSNVTFLNLRNNELKEFPISSPNPNLQELGLSHNNISKITMEDLRNIPGIYRLLLGNNKIKEIPEEIDNLTPKLTTLDVSNNDLSILPLGLGRMSKLNVLCVDGNYFRTMKRNVIEMEKLSGRFYIRITSIVMQRIRSLPKNDTLPITTIWYPHVNCIPNQLKVYPDYRTLTLLGIKEFHVILLNDYLVDGAINSITFHLAKGQVRLTFLPVNKYCANRPDEVIFQKTTTSFCPSDLENYSFQIAPLTKIVVLGIHNHLDDPFVPTAPSHMSSPFHYEPQPSDMKLRASIRRKPYDPETVRRMIMFLDTEFALDQNKKVVAIQVALLDYNGNILLNTNICPRTRVRNYQTKYHGLTEEDLLGEMDEFECIQKINMMVKGRILVGHDLRNDLKALHISEHDLAGIRDTAKSNTIKQKLGCTHQMISLKREAKELCNVDMQEGPHEALKGTLIVRDIYQKVEQEWEESLYLEEQAIEDAMNDEAMELKAPVKIELSDKEQYGIDSIIYENPVKVEKEILVDGNTVYMDH